MKELQARNASSRFNEQNKKDASQQEEDETDSILSQAGAFVPSPVKPLCLVSGRSNSSPHARVARQPGTIEIDPIVRSINQPASHPSAGS